MGEAHLRLEDGLMCNVGKKGGGMERKEEEIDEKSYEG